MHTTNNDPNHVDDVRRTAIEARIDGFQPRSLPPQLAAQVLPRLKELTRLAEPVSQIDAKHLLSTACRLIADTPHARFADDADVDAVLCDATVAAWSHVAQRSGMSPGVLANCLRFLNRLVRARKGLPARATSRRPSKAPAVLLDHQPLATLAERLSRTDRPASAALLVAAGAGLVATADPVGVVIGPHGAVEAVRLEQRAPITARWTKVARQLAGEVADPPAWARLRTAGTELGLQLNGPALRLRWAVDVVAEAPTPQAAVQSGLSRHLLNQTFAVAPGLDDDTARIALRG